MKRGDLVRVALPGDYGKPRPALVVQSNLFAKHASVTLLPLTSAVVDAPLLRVPIEPNDHNQLQKPSQIMIDKPMTIPRDKVGTPFGRASDETMVTVSRHLAVFLGIAT